MWFGFVLMLLILFCVPLLVFGARFMSSKLKLKGFLDSAICIFGGISPLALIMVWATTQDIQKEYLSARLYSKYQTALPSWYVWDVHSCHGEWSTFSVGFYFILIFYVLLFVRFLVVANNQEGQGTNL
jgi:hypothetical protein